MTGYARSIEVVQLSCWDDKDPFSDLQYWIEECSKPSCDRSFDRFRLEVQPMDITRPLLDLMIVLLNLVPQEDPDCQDAIGEERRWMEVEFNNCNFAQRDISNYHVEECDNCTLDDVRRLFSALSHQALNLSINQSPAILSSFLAACPQEQFLVNCLKIDLYESLDELQYGILGGMIGRSVHLRKLELDVAFTAGSEQLLAGLASALQLQDLSITDHVGYLSRDHQLDLGELLVGENGRNGPLIQLLQNPQNQLRKLSIVYLGLKDHHLITIFEMIPNSKIEDLDFSDNLIQFPGMLEFANLLPKMHSLKRVVFHQHDYYSDNSIAVSSEVGQALLDGLTANTRIETMEGIARMPQAPLLKNLIALNRAGRQILESSQPIPDGLWPIFLERAWRSTFRTNCSMIQYLNQRRNAVPSARADVIFYFLQHCPRILSSRMCKGQHESIK